MNRRGGFGNKEIIPFSIERHSHGVNSGNDQDGYRCNKLQPLEDRKGPNPSDYEITRVMPSGRYNKEYDELDRFGRSLRIPEMSPSKSLEKLSSRNERSSSSSRHERYPVSTRRERSPVSSRHERSLMSSRRERSPISSRRERSPASNRHERSVSNKRERSPISRRHEGSPFISRHGRSSPSRFNKSPVGNKHQISSSYQDRIEHSSNRGEISKIGIIEKSGSFHDRSTYIPVLQKKIDEHHNERNRFEQQFSDKGNYRLSTSPFEAYDRFSHRENRSVRKEMQAKSNSPGENDEVTDLFISLVRSLPKMKTPRGEEIKSFLLDLAQPAKKKSISNKETLRHYFSIHDIKQFEDDVKELYKDCNNAQTSAISGQGENSNTEGNSSPNSESKNYYRAINRDQLIHTSKGKYSAGNPAQVIKFHNKPYAENPNLHISFRDIMKSRYISPAKNFPTNSQQPPFYTREMNFMYNVAPQPYSLSMAPVEKATLFKPLTAVDYQHKSMETPRKDLKIYEYEHHKSNIPLAPPASKDDSNPFKVLHALLQNIKQQTQMQTTNEESEMSVMNAPQFTDYSQLRTTSANDTFTPQMNLSLKDNMPPPTIPPSRLTEVKMPPQPLNFSGYTS